MSDAESSDQEKFDDGSWVLEAHSADESANTHTSEADISGSTSGSTYLSTANGTGEIVQLKKRYVENMKRLMRTCRREVESCKTEKEIALRRLAAKEASRLKPERAVKGDEENSIVLTFTNSTQMRTWIALQRINVEGVDIGKGKVSEPNSRITKKGDETTENSKPLNEERQSSIIEKKDTGTQTNETLEGDRTLSKQRSRRHSKGREISDGEIDGEMNSDEGSRTGRKKTRQDRSPSREARISRDESRDRLKKIEEVRRKEIELKRKVEQVKMLERRKEEEATREGGRGGRSTQRWEDGKRRHRHT